MLVKVTWIWLQDQYYSLETPWKDIAVAQNEL